MSLETNIVPFTLWRPRIEPERDGEGWMVITPRGHAWLHGDRRQALAEFRRLERIEQGHLI
jgi:hypothetical protein